MQIIQNAVHQIGKYVNSLRKITKGIQKSERTD